MLYISAIVCAALVAADRLTKIIAEKYLQPIGRLPIIDGVFELSFTRNDGAAFGILQGWRWFFIPFTIIVLGFIAFYYVFYKPPETKHKNWSRAALILVFSGALGNFIDRALYGSVVDFFYFSLIDFPIFNFADIYLSCGAVMFIVLTLFFDKKEKAVQ